jgi:hypothetical protein
MGGRGDWETGAENPLQGGVGRSTPQNYPLSTKKPGGLDRTIETSWGLKFN